jgi:hypothetical protein
MTPVTDVTPLPTVAAIVFLVTPLQLHTCVSSSSRSGAATTMVATSTPAALSLVAVRESRYAAAGSAPVT